MTQLGLGRWLPGSNRRFHPTVPPGGSTRRFHPAVPPGGSNWRFHLAIPHGGSTRRFHPVVTRVPSLQLVMHRSV